LLLIIHRSFHHNNFNKILLYIRLLTATKNTQINIFNELDKPYGKTYGEWTVEWWRWAFSMPKSLCPLLDNTGEKSRINQPEKYVWFLAGIFGTEDNTIQPHRNVTIPSDRSILFPVINCEANSLEYPHLKTDDQLLEHVKRDENSIVKKDVFLNNDRLSVQRVASDPPLFDLTFCKDNSLDITATTTRATADGYYVFIKSLPKGEYNLYFRGACEAGRLNTAATYTLTID
jgi:hypothetical protein